MKQRTKKGKFRKGQAVIDLNGIRKRITRVVWSVAYELDGDDSMLYQPDEIEPVPAHERGPR